MAKSKTPSEPTAAQLADGLVISIGEARKILGKNASNLSDEQVTMQILDMTQAARVLLKEMQFSNKENIIKE